MSAFTEKFLVIHPGSFLLRFVARCNSCGKEKTFAPAAAGARPEIIEKNKVEDRCRIFYTAGLQPLLFLDTYFKEQNV
jgi:hypothetical protein